MYSKETTESINEFFRLMTITMAQLKELISYGRGHIEECSQCSKGDATAHRIQTDMDGVQVLIDNAQEYTDHIEKLLDDCAPEDVVSRRLAALTMVIINKLAEEHMKVDKRLKEEGIDITEEMVNRFRR
jgi:hypothetical protein